MVTLTVAFDHNVPMSLKSAIPFEMNFYCKSMRLRSLG